MPYPVFFTISSASANPIIFTLGMAEILHQLEQMVLAANFDTDDFHQDSVVQLIRRVQINFRNSLPHIHPCKTRALNEFVFAELSDDPINVTQSPNILDCIPHGFFEAARSQWLSSSTMTQLGRLTFTSCTGNSYSTSRITLSISSSPIVATLIAMTGISYFSAAPAQLSHFALAGAVELTIMTNGLPTSFSSS